MADAADSGSAGSTRESSATAVRAQLDRIVKSPPFQQSPRRRRFLEYVVNETLEGRGGRLKGYTIAVEVFDRPSTFDANADPIVRIEAGRLRDRLREFYQVEGQGDPVRIDLPKGSYTPTIAFRQEAEQASSQHSAELSNNLFASPSVQVDGGRAGHASAWTRPVMLAAALLLASTAAIWVLAGRHRDQPLPDKPSIAVLPFNTIGGDAVWGRLADGMTEDIITDLSHSKDLVVIARNSAAVYKDEPVDVRKVGQELNVKYVLEGSIQPIGQRIRVTAQLIDAISGSHVWSERYDRPADDLFLVQSGVTQRIAATLAGYEGPVADAERSLLRRKPPASLTAFDTYLLGMEAKHKVTGDGLIEAERLFHKALELDPNLARAHVGLVDVQFYLIDLGLAPSVAEALSKMMTAGERAVSLDPNDGKTHYAFGLAQLYNGKPEQAAAEFARAQTLSPSDADMLVCIGWSLPMLGQSDRAVELVDQALILNPHYPDWYNQGLSYVYFFGKKFDLSVKYRLLVKQPLALDYIFLAMAYAYLGRTADSAAAGAKAMTLDPAWTAERYLSEAGGFEDNAADFFVDGARKAGLPACVLADKVKGMPNLVRVKSCDASRVGTSN
jgi:TolB-like protein